MNRKIIIIEGYLASGKSTFALELSKSLNIPYIIKDTFKSALCSSVSIINREESSYFSTITFDAMMYIVERLTEVGYPIIIEGNFVPGGIKPVNEASIIKSLIDKYNYQVLTFKFKGDTQVLHSRFVERDKLSKRGQANIMFTELPYSAFDKWCHNLDDFNVGGKIIEIDTTDFNKVDFKNHIEIARLFMLN